MMLDGVNIMATTGESQEKLDTSAQSVQRIVLDDITDTLPQYLRFHNMDFRKSG
jgi:hypothetical protein